MEILRNKKVTKTTYEIRKQNVFKIEWTGKAIDKQY